MHNFGTFFLWALAACILRHESFAEDQSGYVCLIDNPNPNHCDNFYITELRDILNGVVKGQDRGRSYVAGIQAKLNMVVNWQIKLEGLQAAQAKVEDKLERSLHEAKTKLEGQLQGVEAKLEGQLQKVQTNVGAKLEDSLLAVKTKLEGQQMVLTKLEDTQGKLERSLLAVQEKIENQLQAVVNQLQAVSNKIDAAKVDVLTSARGFQLIGERYFQIVHEKENWVTAGRRCRDRGGYLASFQNEKELTAVKAKLKRENYWLGINDRDREGQFESLPFNNPPQFMKWLEGDPNDEDHKENCIALHRDSGMFDHFCDTEFYFICLTEYK